MAKEALASAKGVLTRKKRIRKHLRRLLSPTEARALAAKINPYAAAPALDPHTAAHALHLQATRHYAFGRKGNECPHGKTLGRRGFTKSYE
jgi:hypothetical protein